MLASVPVRAAHLIVLVSVATLFGAACVKQDQAIATPTAAAVEDIAVRCDNAGREGANDQLMNGAVWYHWAAIQAIKAGDVTDALDAVEHIMELASGKYLEAVEAVAEQLRAGRFHDAEHAIEELLAGGAEPSLTAGQLQLQLALAELAAGDPADARHHVLHFLETEQGDELSEGRALLPILKAGRFNEATSRIRKLVLTLTAPQSNANDCDACAGDRSADDPRQVRALVLFDAEWKAHHGDAADAAASVVRQAAEALVDADVTLSIVGPVLWDSGDAASLSEMGGAVAEAFDDERPAELLIALTHRDVEGTIDGIHLSGHHTIVVKYQHDKHLESAQVLVHEIGHHLGLSHEAGTYMQSRGFPESLGWSDCQREVLNTPADR